MPYRQVVLNVDLSDIEGRLDAIEGAGTDVLSALVICLKEKRLKDKWLLTNKLDGDQVTDEDGNLTVWSDQIRDMVQAEVTETERLIAALSND